MPETTIFGSYGKPTPQVDPTPQRVKKPVINPRRFAKGGMNAGMPGYLIDQENEWFDAYNVIFDWEKAKALAPRKTFGQLVPSDSATSLTSLSNIVGPLVALPLYPNVPVYDHSQGPNPEPPFDPLDPYAQIGQWQQPEIYIAPLLPVLGEVTFLCNFSLAASATIAVDGGSPVPIVSNTSYPFRTGFIYSVNNSTAPTFNLTIGMYNNMGVFTPYMLNTCEIELTAATSDWELSAYYTQGWPAPFYQAGGSTSFSSSFSPMQTSGNHTPGISYTSLDNALWTLAGAFST